MVRFVTTSRIHPNTEGKGKRSRPHLYIYVYRDQNDVSKLPFAPSSKLVMPVHSGMTTMADGHPVLFVCYGEWDSMSKTTNTTKACDIVVFFSPSMPARKKEIALYTIAEHLYSFDKYKTPSSSFPERVVYMNCNKKQRSRLSDVLHRIHVIDIVRNLQNEPSNVMTPDVFCSTVQELFNQLTTDQQKERYTISVYDESEIDAMGMHLLGAVGQGSQHPPRFMVIEYRNNPDAHDIVLAGKGITFDTGGVSLKSIEGMQHMHHDKSGAAVVAGTLLYMVTSNKRVNLVGLIPLAENAIGSKAYKPSDVIKSYSGKTVEIIDTDAEGRLILADALAYVKHYPRVSMVVDMATLTGGAERLYPGLAATYFTTNDELMSTLQKTGRKVGEKVWPMPMWDDKGALLKSDVANLKNDASSSSSAMTYMAAQFLLQFVPSHLKNKWIHMDIGKNTRREGREGIAVGSCTRLLIELLLTRVHH
jgi:leucyl aminopeptidase